jgi:hypothetical protein
MRCKAGTTLTNEDKPRLFEKDESKYRGWFLLVFTLIERDSVSVDELSSIGNNSFASMCMGIEREGKVSVWIWYCGDNNPGQATSHKLEQPDYADRDWLCSPRVLSRSAGIGELIYFFAF